MGLDSLDLDTEYRTGEVDIAAEFYRPCFAASTAYDRAVAYFRSSAFAVYGFEVLAFARSGGRIRLVCSPEMNEADVKAVLVGHTTIEAATLAALEQNLEDLIADPHGNHCAKVLGTLVNLGVVDLRIARTSSGSGIYHEKIGIFSDDSQNAVSFIGSSNETWSGLHPRGNYERNEVFCTWRSDIDARRVKSHRDHFERLWVGTVPGIDVLPLPEAVKARLIEVSPKTLAEAEALIRNDMSAGPTFVPRDHQREAIKNWQKVQCRGVLEHATGSGKTITAIIGLRWHLGINGTALVLVPSRLLLEQWISELEEHIPEAAILPAGGGHQQWRSPGTLRSFTRPSVGVRPRIVVSTMQTARTDDFLGRLAAGDHLMVVADEVHQIGAPELSKCLEIPSGRRLGLSATPSRYLDPTGTQRIVDYFGPIIQPPFTLKDAITCRALCHYEYYPSTVTLTDEELDEWSRLTKQLSIEIGRADHGGSSVPLTDRAIVFLVQRARIAKKAIHKVNAAETIIRTHYKEGQRWLVYCDDQDQMRQVSNALRKHVNACAEFHSAMEGDRNATLTWFSRFGGIVVAINCLDEGVDIPQASHALVLASSQNPRQFIQRRGRVLRRAPHKHVAVIHDAIVVPSASPHEDNQLSLAYAELARAIKFAQDAVNPGAAIEVKRIAIAIGIDPDNLAERGIEEEVGAENDS